jgi:hypothetical protein
VTPIPIKLNDHWTHHRLTRIEWHGEWFTGCGISFDVWRHLFSFDDSTWFAGVYGAYHDNFVAVSVAPAMHPDVREPFALSSEALEEENVSPEVSACDFGALTPALLHQLGFSELEDVTLNEHVSDLLHLHDDFLFSLGSRQFDVVQAALPVIVRVHAYYMKQALPAHVEERLISQCRALLETEGPIELQSDPASGQIVIRQERPAEGWFARFFGRKRQEEISISVPPSDS